MKSIKILGNGRYLPQTKVDNTYFNTKFNLKEKWIEKRTGIDVAKLSFESDLETLSQTKNTQPKEHIQVLKQKKRDKVKLSLKVCLK